MQAVDAELPAQTWYTSIHAGQLRGSNAVRWEYRRQKLRLIAHW